MQVARKMHTAPIFVVGTPRSGTTLTAQILGKHSRIFMPGETHFFEDIYANRKMLGDPGDHLAMERIVDSLSTLYGRYCGYESPDQKRIDRLFSDASVFAQFNVRCRGYQDLLSAFMEMQQKEMGKARWGNNAPRDVFYVQEILTFYPDARFVFCVRDVRDFLLSYKDKWKFISANYAERLKKLYHPVVTSLLWRSTMRILPRIREKVPDGNLIVVRYEELVKDPEITVCKICDVVGEEFEPAMLDINTHNSSSGEDKQGIYSSSIGRWRYYLSNEEVCIAQQMTRKELHNLGYAVEPVSANPIEVAKLYASAPWCLIQGLWANREMRGPLLPYLMRRLSLMQGK